MVRRPFTLAQLFNQFGIIPEPPAPVSLDKGNGGSANEIDEDPVHFLSFFDKCVTNAAF